MLPKVPSYRLHKASGQAFVQVKGRRHYLGKHGSPESEERYQRFVAELLSGPKPETTPLTTPGAEYLVVQLCAAYWSFAEGYYVKDGIPSRFLSTIKLALRELRKLYGNTPARSFGPLAFRAMQQRFLQGNPARGYVNKLTAVVKRAFKWGASHELVPITVYQALATVPGLRKGRTAAREPEPVKPVPDVDVDATLPHLPAVVADMVRLQRLTGARPGEVCALRPCDVDRSGEVWTYRPEHHKTEHHDRVRTIFIGPKAQAVLLPYLLRAAESYCFSPAESEAQRKAERRSARKTRVQPSQVDRSRRRPKRKAKDRYTKDSYRRAIARAVELANRDRDQENQIAHWHPNQLRHTAATEIRKAFGLEAAQVVLGHSRADVTQVYAERDSTLAEAVAKKIG